MNERPEQPSTLAELEAQLLGGPRTLTLAQVAERVGADVGEVRLFWHALGLPTGPPDAVEYTEQDARVVGEVLRAQREHGIGVRAGVSLVRAVGHTMDRLVLWQVEALVEHMAETHGLDDTSARLAVLGGLAELAPVLEQQLLHGWRRQLAAIAGRFAEEFGTAGRVSPSDELPLARAVGFADIVSFTTRTAGLGSHDLADFVQGFETRARDIVTGAGGRVVKTIGDAVLFVADHADTGARIALGLAGEFGAESPTPVRVGLVWGRVLSRFGDVFGPSVNLAARLTEQAHAGEVLLDQVTAEQLRSVPAAPSASAVPAAPPVPSTTEPSATPPWTLTEQPERDVPGLGPLRPVRLEG